MKRARSGHWHSPVPAIFSSVEMKRTRPDHRNEESLPGVSAYRQGNRRHSVETAGQCSCKTRFFQAMTENTEIFCTPSLPQIIWASAARRQSLRFMYFKDSYAHLYTGPKMNRHSCPVSPGQKNIYIWITINRKHPPDFGGLLPFLMPGRPLILCRIPPSPALKKISFSPCVINWLSNDGDCFQERRIYYG